MSTKPAEVLNLEPLEESLGKYDQFVLWRYEQVDPQKKAKKPPYDPKNPSRKASTSDPGTWGSLEVALDALRENREFDGIGFVLTEDDPYCAIDLDRMNTSDDAMTAGLEIVARLNTYAEMSPSGDGLHLIGIGRLPRGIVRSTYKGQRLELFVSGQYITLTGNRAGGDYSEVRPCQEALDELRP